MQKTVSSIIIPTIHSCFHDEYGKQTEEFDEIMASGIPFEDKVFPPTRNSLALKWDALSKKQQQKWSTFQWKKANQIFKKAQIFEGAIEANDIKQGQLGDCYFLSALSVLAEQNQYVTRLFHTREPNDQGVFSVWLNCNGEWKNIVIDDKFPCLETGPAFSRANGEELWVIIMEKAYAKLYGSYQRIEGGNPSMALRDLTGAPYENKDECTVDELWTFLWESNMKRFLLTCYTKSTATTEEENQLGILSGHAYAILRLAQVQDKNNQLARILKVRNPWGRVEWKGAWSDQSDQWTPQLRQTLQLSQKEDGQFWISIEDFRQYYEGVGVCKIHPDYMYNSLKLEKQDRMIIYLESKSPSHGYVSVNQVDERFFQSDEYAYAYARIMIGKIDGRDQISYVASSYAQDRNVDCEIQFEQGDYLILIDVDWNSKQSKINQLVFNTYSGSPLVIRTCTTIDALELEKHLYKDYALNNPVKLVSYKNEHKLDIEKRICAKSGMFFFYYRNGTKDTDCQESIKFSDLRGYEILPPFKLDDNQIIKFTVEPESELVILFKQIVTADLVSAYSYKTSTLLPKHKGSKQNSFYLVPIMFDGISVSTRAGQVAKLDMSNFQQKSRRNNVQPEVANIVIQSAIIQKPPQISNPQQNAQSENQVQNQNQSYVQFDNEPTNLEVHIVQMMDEFSMITKWSVVFLIVVTIQSLQACVLSFAKPKILSLTVVTILSVLLLTNNLLRPMLRNLMILQGLAILYSLINIFFQNPWQELVNLRGVSENIFNVLFWKFLFIIEMLEFFMEIATLLMMVRIMVKYDTFRKELFDAAEQRILLLEERIDSYQKS